MRTFLCLLALVLPLAFLPHPADAQGIETPVHPSALNRPAITPVLQSEYGGWYVDLDIQDVWSAHTESFPEVNRDTQLIWLPIPDDWDEPMDYHLRVNCTYYNVDDTYGCENLTDEFLSAVDGSSYTIPQLIVNYPIPWWWTGGDDHNGSPFFGTSTTKGWQLGSMSPFDGSFDWAGSSGNTDGWTPIDNPGWSHTTTQYTTLRWFSGRDHAEVYFAPVLNTTWPEWWDGGVRCDEQGNPLVKGERVGVGHGGLRPWFHEWKWNRIKFRVHFVRQ